MTKEQLAQWLVELDENVLQVAVMYAENYLKYGVDVTEKWNTAVRQQYSLEKAQRQGFINGQRSVIGIITMCRDCKYAERHCCDSVFGKPLYACKHIRQIGNGSIVFPEDFYCADGRRKDEDQG